MVLGEYLPTSCSTDGVKGLTMQVADILKTRMAAEIVDISAHVEIVGPTTIPFLQTAAGNALIAAINKKGEKPRLVHAIRVLPQQHAVHYWISSARTAPRPRPPRRGRRAARSGRQRRSIAGRRSAAGRTPAWQC